MPISVEANQSLIVSAANYSSVNFTETFCRHFSDLRLRSTIYYSGELNEHLTATASANPTHKGIKQNGAPALTREPVASDPNVSVSAVSAFDGSPVSVFACSGPSAGPYNSMQQLCFRVVTQLTDSTYGLLIVNATLSVTFKDAIYKFPAIDEGCTADGVSQEAYEFDDAKKHRGSAAPSDYLVCFPLTQLCHDPDIGLRSYDRTVIVTLETLVTFCIISGDDNNSKIQRPPPLPRCANLSDWWNASAAAQFGPPKLRIHAARSRGVRVKYLDPQPFSTEPSPPASSLPSERRAVNFLSYLPIVVGTAVFPFVVALLMTLHVHGVFDLFAPLLWLRRRRARQSSPNLKTPTDHDEQPTEQPEQVDGDEESGGQSLSTVAESTPFIHLPNGDSVQPPPQSRLPSLVEGVVSDDSPDNGPPRSVARYRPSDAATKGSMESIGLPTSLPTMVNDDTSVVGKPGVSQSNPTT